LVVLTFKVIVVTFISLLVLLGEVTLLLLGKHLLMLFLHSSKLVMSFVIDGTKLILVVLINHVLNCLDIFRLELLWFFFRSSYGSSHNWHLFWGSFSIL